MVLVPFTCGIRPQCARQRSGEAGIGIGDAQSRRVRRVADGVGELGSILQRRGGELVDGDQAVVLEAGGFHPEVADVEHQFLRQFALDVEVPLLHVGVLAVLRVYLAGPVLVAPGAVEAARTVAVGGESLVPVENTGPGVDGVGAERIGAAPGGVGGLAQRRPVVAVERVGIVHDAVGAAHGPLVAGAPGEADAWAESLPVLGAEVVLPGAARSSRRRNRRRRAGRWPDP